MFQAVREASTESLVIFCCCFLKHCRQAPLIPRMPHPDTPPRHHGHTETTPKLISPAMDTTPAPSRQEAPRSCSVTSQVTGNPAAHLLLFCQTSSASSFLGFPASLPWHLPGLPGCPKLPEPALQPTAQLVLQLPGAQSCTVQSPNYQAHGCH